MAGRARLSRPAPALALALLLVAVLLVHEAVIAWLAAQWREPAALRPLATPMFTRQIEPAPAPAPATIPAPVSKPVLKPNRPKVQVQRSLNAINSVANEITPTTPTPTALIPPEPEPPPREAEPVTTAATPAASEPSAAASATPSAALPSPTAFLDAWPADTRLSYRLGGQYRGELHGTAQVQWQREGSRYQVRVTVDIGWFVNATFTSQGEITPAGLVPRTYEELVATRRRTAVLDDSVITLGDGRRVPRPDGVQDTASQFVALSHQFASGQSELVVGRSVSFWMARPGGVDRWTYQVQAKETLRLPRLGEVEAFHLKPEPLANPRGNITADMWFAPALQHLPVRIRISMGDGNFVDLLAEKIEQR